MKTASQSAPTHQFRKAMHGGWYQILSPQSHVGRWKAEQGVMQSFNMVWTLLDAKVDCTVIG